MGRISLNYIWKSQQNTYSWILSGCSFIHLNNPFTVISCTTVIEGNIWHPKSTWEHSHRYKLLCRDNMKTKQQTKATSTLSMPFGFYLI